MDKRIERLHALGCDTAGALERMADDEEFYLECLQEALENPGFDGLAQALAAGDVETAFDCAHALKGILGNVGLTPLYRKDIELVEPLRVGNCAGLTEKLEELLTMRRQYAEIVA